MKQVLFLLFPFMLFSQTNLDKARKLFEDKKYEQAKPIFESLLKSNTTNVEIIESLGDIAGAYKSWPEAMEYYKRLKILKPYEANYFYKYGGAMGMYAKDANKFKALGMIDEVKASFEKAIELDAKHIDARWALIELYIQLPGIVGGSESKAIRYSNELSAISLVEGLLSRGHIDEYFKRYKAAENAYKKAITVNSSSFKSYKKLADLYRNKMNELAKANAIQEQIKKLN
jgi:tetratricopeptide (TPR) repeat protein